MRDPDNIASLAGLKPDLLGFIFYPGSKRYVLDKIKNLHSLNIASDIERVGVFVNEKYDQILEYTQHFGITTVQLHGVESREECLKLKQAGYKVIKAILIGEESDLQQCNGYSEVADIFLFDTKSEQYGGTGKKFDWSVLQSYNLQVPFLISGGISANDIPDLSNFVHPYFLGVDINSKFEVEPGLKDVEKVKEFIREFNATMFK